MEGQLEWKERYNIGIDQIDGQHQRLFRIINKLRAISEDEEKEPWVCQEGIKFFKSYALNHFAQEEAYMASISYKYLETHKRLHNDFRLRRLPALEKELEDAEYAKDAIDHLRGVCTGWLIEHIQGEDQIIGKKEVSKWANLLPQDELESVEQTVMEILQEMFQQEPKLLSECYSGENFGDEIYYRFTYGEKEWGKQDMILIFEKKLLISMIENLAEDPQERNGAMLLEVVRSTAKELEDMEEYSFLRDDCELLGENQLTGDQFRRTLQRQQPKFSLLFDTGEGYFGLCAMTPHLVPKEGGASPQPEQAASETEEASEDTKKEEPETRKKTRREKQENRKKAEKARKKTREIGKDPKEAKKAQETEKGPEKAGKIQETGKDPKEAKKAQETEEVKKGSAGAEKAFEGTRKGPEQEAADQEQKKKVLVVDDVETARKVMKKVLEKDYQVTLARSGISAIRCMAIERPDMIILDYNMPVCGGAQLLEMIRSEADFVDIPVIFLSSTIDKEGVKRIVPLKPEGYFLKSMKPIEIKKKVDHYFARKGRN